MVPADDQAMVLPCASVMVIIVLLKVAFTCATPEVIFLRSRRRTRAAAAGFVVVAMCPSNPRPKAPGSPIYFVGASFLPAIGRAGPLRVRALVCVRCPRTG